MFWWIQNILYLLVVIYYWGSPNFIWLIVLFVFAFIINMSIFSGAIINRKFQSIKILIFSINITISFMMISLTGHAQSPFFPMYYLPSISLISMLNPTQKVIPMFFIASLTSLYTAINIVIIPNVSFIDYIKLGVYIVSYYALGFSRMFHRNLLAQTIKNTEIDYLTNVYTKQMGDTILKAKVQEARSERKYVSICFCDLDHFKKLNDQHGHLCGDFILKQIAEILKNSTPKEASVIRWGGEEFLIVFNELDKYNALEIMERICKKIELQSFTYENKKLSVTISGGIVDSSEFDYDPIKMLDEADKLLYCAKKQGRNQIVISEEKIKIKI